MARAQMTDITSEVTPTGDIKLTWRILFHGQDVARPDSDLAEVTMAATSTKADTKTAIRAATLARATALGYTVPSNGLYTLEELFAGV